MSANFQIEFKESNGNLHVRPKGDIDGSSAWKLINFLHEKYNGRGRVFIDTHNLQEICPFGCSTFKCNLNRRILPPDRLIFKGKKGFELARDGNKVIVLTKKPKCRCNGNCANCQCGNNGKQN